MSKKKLYIKCHLIIFNFLLLMSYSLILLFDLLIFKHYLIIFDNSLSVLYLLTLLFNLMISFYCNLFIKEMLLFLLTIIKSIFFKTIYLLLFKHWVIY